jgi:murein DD-endopeptidase / murein LD-carboxypeptidase
MYAGTRCTPPPPITRRIQRALLTCVTTIIIGTLAGCSSSRSLSQQDPDCKYSLKKRKTYITCISPGSAAPMRCSLPIKVSENLFDRFFTSINNTLGVRYRYGGTTKDGFDCSGLVVHLYKETFQMQLPRTAAELSSLGSVVQKNRIRPGDLIFFSTEGNVIDHVGIVIDENRFAHAATRGGVTISRLTERYYNQRYACASRIISRD